MPPTLPLVLLPPSEGKAPGGRGAAWRAGSMSIDLDEARREVLGALVDHVRSAPEAELAKLLGVKGAALEAATRADLAVLDAPTMPAIERYTGVLYGELDAGSLDASGRRRLRSSVLVASGLWGLVAPGDAIPDYKLKMGAALPPLGKLSTWWREPLTEALAVRARGRIVWNLLPQEHDAAWRPDRVDARAMYTVRFLERRADGSLQAVSHWNKLLKGALVRLLVEQPATDPASLRRWRHPLGYRLDPSMTEQHGPLTALSFVQRDS